MKADGPYFIFAEDLCSALVGPFDTREAAEAHITFCEDRGDGATMEVISNFIMTQIDSRNIGMTLTPDQDRHAVDPLRPHPLGWAGVVQQWRIQ